MPELVAAAAAAVIGAGTAATAIGYGTTLVASIGFARYNQRKAARQQQASLQDRTTPVRQSDAARSIVYGRTRVSGPIVYHKTHGSRNESVSHVIPLAGHEITAVDDVWFNDKSIAPWSGGPVSAGSPYFVSRAIAYAHRFTGSAATQSLPVYGGTFVTVDTVSYTDAATISGGTGDGYFIVDDSREVPLALGTGYTVGGTASAPTLTLVGTAAHGKPVTVTYRVDLGAAYASVYVFLGAAAGQRDTNLETWSGGEWASTAIGCNVARLHVRTDWQETLYATGFPGVSAIVRGKKVYDPRLDSTNGGSGSHRADTASTWAYSDNPALCAADYLRDVLGFGCASTEIDWPSVIAAANVCDELVPIDAGSGTQKRYTVAGVLSTETDRKTNLEAILDAMVGIAVYSGGKWSIDAGAYATPTLDLDEGDLAGGDITIQARANRRDLFNAVRGRYREPTQLYQVTDFPPYASSTYAAEDGGETIYREIDLQLVDDARRAQRIAKLILFRARQALTIQATFKLSTYALQPGDTCRLTIARYGWTNKVFRVLRREFSSLSTVRLTLQEDASAIYAWNFSEALVPDPAPNTGLPDPRFVAIPAGVTIASSASTYYVKQDGTLVPYVAISWTVPTADDVHVEVFWKRSGETEFRRVVASVGASFVWLEGVAPGEVLNIHLYAVNGIGARSAPVWRPSYTVAADAPSALMLTVENELKGVTFEYGTGDMVAAGIGLSSSLVAIGKHPAEGYYVPGPVSSAWLSVDSAASGLAQYAKATWPRVPVQPNQQYALYASLIGWECDAQIAVDWLDGNRNYISSDGPAVVPAVANESAGARWNNPVHYGFRGKMVAAPPNAYLAEVSVRAAGSWSTFATKNVSIYRPFFARVPRGLAMMPPWNAGPVAMVGTNFIAPESTTAVYEDTTQPAVISWLTPGQSWHAGLPSAWVPIDADIEHGALLRVHLNISVALTGKVGAGSFSDIAAIVGVYDMPVNAAGAPIEIATNGVLPIDDLVTAPTLYGGSSASAGFLFDQHLSAARSMEGVTLRGTYTGALTYRWLKGAGRRFGVVITFDPTMFPLANSTFWQIAVAAPSRMSIEVIKR